MNSNDRLGGIIHTYQKFDPVDFPSPTAPPPDMVSPAFEHLLFYGNTRRLTEEELARAIRIDPSQIQGLGPSLEALMAMLAASGSARSWRPTRPSRSRTTARQQFARVWPSRCSRRPSSPGDFRRRSATSSSTTWNSSGIGPATSRAGSPASSCSWCERLGEKYQVDELAAKYEFTGRTPMTVPEALEIKQELETIDRLLKQLEEAAKTAQIGIIDLEELAQFAEPGDIEQLSALQQQIQDYLREMAEQQGLEQGKHGLSDDAQGLPPVPVAAA